MKIPKWLLIGVVIVLIPIVFMGLRALLFPVKGAVKAIDTAYGVLDETMDPKFAIYNYEWFKQTAEDIQALHNKEANAEGLITQFMETMDNSSADKTELARLRSIKMGLSNMLEDTMAKYNARSKMANRAIFKDNLPSNMSRSWLATVKLIR
ncbi:hypothetical protein ES705_44629 [subsurface metagenome]